jgi:hypothetical protein
MKSAIVAVLCVAAFAMRTSGQATTTYTFICPSIPPIPTEHSELPNTLPALVITSDYYVQPKVLVLHAINNSGKDITGYTIIIRHKKADGALDENGRSESMEDMLGVLIASQMAKTPAHRKAYGSKIVPTQSSPKATASSSQAKHATKL